MDKEKGNWILVLLTVIYVISLPVILFFVPWVLPTFYSAPDIFGKVVVIMFAALPVVLLGGLICSQVDRKRKQYGRARFWMLLPLLWVAVIAMFAWLP